MFNFIKKTTRKLADNKSTHSQIADLEAVVTQVLSSSTTNTAHPNNAKEQNTLTGLKHQGDSVTLDLRLSGESDPEEIHRQLGQALHPYGIKEINMNVSLPPKVAASTSIPMPMTSKEELPIVSTKGAGNKLPKITDATAPKASADNVSNKSTNQSANKPSNQTSATTEPPIAKRAPTQSSLKPHPRIKHIIVVASGKGGVGKSTTTVNIALALLKLGNRVGVLDADIYGPSMPSMLGVEGIKPQLENEQFVPIEAHGLAMLSIGSLLDGDNTPVAWRGPKATGALMQLFNQTNWPMLDYLVIDMPPGTGDIQLTLAQRIPVTGAVIVTTPQHIALMDAQKGIEMFNKTNIPVIGVVENMALHTCSSCGHTEAIFGSGGGETIAENYQVPLLGQLPLAIDIRAQVDKGEPSVIANNGAGDDYAEFYVNIAKKVEANIAKFAKERNDGRIF